MSTVLKLWEKIILIGCFLLSLFIFQEISSRRYKDLKTNLTKDITKLQEQNSDLIYRVEYLERDRKGLSVIPKTRQMEIP